MVYWQKVSKDRKKRKIITKMGNTQWKEPTLFAKQMHTCMKYQNTCIKYQKDSFANRINT